MTTLCNSKYDDIIIKLEINNRITLKFPNVCKLNNIFLNNTCESNKKLQYTLGNILNWMQIKIDSRAPYWKHLKVHQQGKKNKFYVFIQWNHKTIKRNELLMYTTWMNFTDITLSKWTAIQQHTILPISSPKWAKLVTKVIKLYT